MFRIGAGCHQDPPPYRNNPNQSAKVKGAVELGSVKTGTAITIGRRDRSHRAAAVEHQAQCQAPGPGRKEQPQNIERRERARN